MSRRTKSILLGSTLAVVLAGASLVTPAAAFADGPAGDEITDAQSLNDAFGDGGAIYLGDENGGGTWDEAATVFTVGDGKTVTLDLNGHQLAVTSIKLGAASTLTLLDSSSTRGWLHAIAPYSNGLPGIQLVSTSMLTIDGATILAQTGVGGNVAAIGSAIDQTSGTIHITGAADVTATSLDAGGAGIGGGFNNGSGAGSGAITIDGSAVVHATGGTNAAGIGGGYQGDLTSALTIAGSADVTAIGGASSQYGEGGAGIGAGMNAALSSDITISGSAHVHAEGGSHAAGIGSGSSHGVTSTITISESATVTAIGGAQAAGIGTGSGGNLGDDAGTIAILDSATVTATGGPLDTDGESAGAGIGAGFYNSGGSVTINTSSTVTAADGGDHSSAIGANYEAPGVDQGSLTLTRGTLVIPAGATLFRGQATVLINNGTIVNHGTIVGDGTGATILNSATIQNYGALTNVTVKRHNYVVTLNAVGGTVSPTSVAVYAASLSSGGSALPVPVRTGYAFDGWTLTDDASGLITAETVFTDNSDGTPIVYAAHALWSFIPIETTTTIALSTPVVVSGTAVTATPTLTAGATGAVSISSDGTLLGSTTSGVPFALPSLTVGTHTITASYPGDASHSGSAASATLTVTATVATGTPIPSTAVAHPKLTVTAKKFAKNHKPKVTLTFSKLAAGQKVTGKVAVYVGGKKVKTVTISKKTVASVTLPKRYAKAISVKAVFAGSSTIAKTTSKTVKIRLK